MTPPSVALGAQVEGGGTRFALYTSAAAAQLELLDELELVTARLPLEPLGDGYFERWVPDVTHGALYRFVVDGRSLPDPHARFLPRGVHGPAQVWESRYTFQHPQPQRPLSRQVIYELHVGTFTSAGTFAALRRRLPVLAELGITTLELMPVAAFAGQHGWGYDGVALFAPHAAYGTPDELRELVDAAHGLGLSVLLDVVYNHFGPSGNYLGAFSPEYFHRNLENAWGKAPHFEHPALRALVLDNARYWLEQFRFDGLRLDATHAIVDHSERHVIAELAQLAHSLSPPRLIIAEDERNLAELVTVDGADALWADDFHHQLRVTLSGDRHGYYAAYEPSVRGLADVIQGGWLYSGQRSPVTGEPRGTSAAELPASAFVYCIQNHDQVGNRPFGDRLSGAVSATTYRAASLLLLFLPMTPLLFQGQEWGTQTPFRYFTDHEPELGEQVSEGRRREFAGFPEFADERARERIPDPQAPDTFSASKLHWSERELPEHAATLELYRAALELRRSDEVLTHSGREALQAEALGDVLVVQRWHGSKRRVLLVNLAQQPAPLAPLVEQLRLRDVQPLLASSLATTNDVEPGGALLLAAERDSAAAQQGSP